MTDTFHPGLKIMSADYVIALAGNPNTGKSTVFNALTGMRQHTGNWTGKTVERAEGVFRFEGKTYRLVDLPGTYSLFSTSPDEAVARDFILFGQPQCTLVVVDASSLERNLNLVLQILEITSRSVVALNLIDEAKRSGIEVDHEVLAQELGVPVVPLVARQGKGIPDLLRAVAQVASGERVLKPYKVPASGYLEKAIAELGPLIEQAYPGLPNEEWVALRLLDGDPQMRNHFLSGDLGSLLGRGRPAN